MGARRFDRSHVEIRQAFTGETGTKSEELVPTFSPLAGVPQKIGFVIQFDAQRPLSKLFQLVHFAICDKYIESAARLCSPFQGEKRFCKIHRSLHEISLIGLMLDFCTLC